MKNILIIENDQSSDSLHNRYDIKPNISYGKDKSTIVLGGVFVEFDRSNRHRIYEYPPQIEIKEKD